MISVALYILYLKHVHVFMYANIPSISFAFCFVLTLNYQSLNFAGN